MAGFKKEKKKKESVIRLDSHHYMTTKDSSPAHSFLLTTVHSNPCTKPAPVLTGGTQTVSICSHSSIEQTARGRPSLCKETMTGRDRERPFIGAFVKVFLMATGASCLIQGLVCLSRPPRLDFISFFKEAVTCQLAVQQLQCLALAHMRWLTCR